MQQIVYFVTFKNTKYESSITKKGNFKMKIQQNNFYQPNFKSVYTTDANTTMTISQLNDFRSYPLDTKYTPINEFLNTTGIVENSQFKKITREFFRNYDMPIVDHNKSYPLRYLLEEDKVAFRTAMKKDIAKMNVSKDMATGDVLRQIDLKNTEMYRVMKNWFKNAEHLTYEMFTKSNGKILEKIPKRACGAPFRHRCL